MRPVEPRGQTDGRGCGEGVLAGERREELPPGPEREHETREQHHDADEGEGEDAEHGRRAEELHGRVVAQSGRGRPRRGRTGRATGGDGCRAGGRSGNGVASSSRSARGGSGPDGAANGERRARGRGRGGRGGHEGCGSRARPGLGRLRGHDAGLGRLPRRRPRGRPRSDPVAPARFRRRLRAHRDGCRRPGLAARRAREPTAHASGRGIRHRRRDGRVGVAGTARGFDGIGGEHRIRGGGRLRCDPAAPSGSRGGRSRRGGCRRPRLAARLAGETAAHRRHRSAPHLERAGLGARILRPRL